MGEAITSGILELAIALSGLVVTAIVGWAGTAAKKVLDSKQVATYTEALRNWDQEVWQQALELGRAVYEKVSTEAKEFPDSEAYEEIERGILEHANRYARRAGVRTELSSEHLDALIRAAMAEGKKAWRESYGS